MRCERFRSQLEKYLLEELDQEQRSKWRLHLQECGECRVWALAEEPSLLFQGVLTEPGGDSDQVRQCVDSVTAMIRQDSLSRKLRWRPRMRLGAAAAVLVAVLGGALWVTELGQPETVIAEEFEHQGETTVARPEVEFEMDGEGVRIYQLADDHDSTVWFVVNPDLES